MRPWLWESHSHGPYFSVGDDMIKFCTCCVNHSWFVNELDGLNITNNLLGQSLSFYSITVDKLWILMLVVMMNLVVIPNVQTGAHRMISWWKTLLESMSGAMHHLHACLHSSNNTWIARPRTHTIHVHALLCLKVLAIGSTCSVPQNCLQHMIKVSACW